MWRGAASRKARRLVRCAGCGCVFCVLPIEILKSHFCQALHSSQLDCSLAACCMRVTAEVCASVCWFWCIH